MANTYTQMYVMIVFSVKRQMNLINERIEDEIYRYITGIVKNHGHKLLQINGMPDHIHIFLNFKPNQCVSDLVCDIKSNSSKFINEKDWFIGKYHWQEGFGAFSYSHSQINSVINYIANQKEHHKTKTFREEYIELLDEFGIEYEEMYIFN